MTFIKLKYGQRQGMVQEFPFSIAKELVDAGRAEMVSFDDQGKDAQVQLETGLVSEPAPAGTEKPVAATTKSKSVRVKGR